jgi:regulator of RNase E activity RraA
MGTPLSSGVLEALSEFDSPTISNAVEHFKVRDPVTGYASLELSCQFPDLGPMVGYAVTCTADSTAPGDDRPHQLNTLLDALHAAPKPSILVIEYVGDDRLRSCFVGEGVCMAIQRLGAVGVVTDGGIRDKSGIRQRAPGFQVFSPGLVVSHGYGAYLEFGVNVSICGMTIGSGDLLHGDENGLLTIPLDIAEATLDQAGAVRKAEKDLFDFLEGSAFTYEALKGRLGRH